MCCAYVLFVSIPFIRTLLGSVSVRCMLCMYTCLYVSISFSTWRIMGIVVSVCCVFICIHTI